MIKLSIIGTSKIVEEHIKVAVAAGFELFSITSTRKNSKNLKKLSQKYNFKYTFNNWKIAVNHSNKYVDTSFLVAPRIQDTHKILKYIISKDKYVFVEKPLTIKINQFKNLMNYNNKIFIGYNRIFYDNIIFLKKKLKKINNIIVKCPELDKKNILYNSVHMLSILIYLLGDLKVIIKKKDTKYIFLYLENKKKIPVYIYFNFKAYENFSISIYSNKKKYLLKPLETLNVYDGIIAKVNPLNSNLIEYFPKLKFKKNEFNNNYFKPGFLNQMKAFKKFIKTKNKVHNNLIFGKKIISLAKNIIS